MQVKRKLHINAGLSAVVVVVIALLLFLGTNRISDTFRELELVNNILSSLYVTNTLRSDYLKTGGQRAKIQWLAENEQTGKLLNSALKMFENAEDKKTLDHMINDHESSTILFMGIVENREKAHSGEISIRFFREIENRLLTQVNIRLYEKVLNIHALREAARQRLYTELKITGWGTVFVIVIAASIAAIGSWTMSRTIANRIEGLRKGAAVIGEGNLGYRIGIKGNDEFAELSVAFNAMTEKLSLSYRELEKEIADRKLAEEEKEKLIAELEAANKELQGFTYSVSHDLRAPIRHMSSFAQLLKEDAWPVLGEQSRSYLSTVLKASRKMGILVDELLEFSRMGRMELKKAPVDLNIVIGEARQSLSVETGDRDIRWKISALPMVLGDAAMLQLVFLNLIGNALKFTRNRSPAIIEIGHTEEETEHVFFVRDNGIGFDMQYYDKLFGIFQRLHTAEGIEGTGIGLANVARIVQRHGGRVWTKAKVNEGAVFYLSLPKENVKKNG